MKSAPFFFAFFFTFP
ncbi:pheA operon leader peptide PheL [Erwinia aphidicola]|uniref:PheA operon leader peptide PheL n=1 Tax=Erwinia aphidicola TaxID=68334 RepID=A0ABU8DDG1_ERWAP|nr:MULTISPECIES: pheA operon leader peptide PheL [Erwinia]MBD1378500.1 pheA operon leader peptide PheL [Erwinia aphidicola]MDI3442556.1 pheA operon leader peptide PheL [Erwinia sp. V90_4]